MTQLTGRPILGVPGEVGGRPVPADLLTGVRTALVGLAVVGVPVLGLWVITPYADDGAAGATRLAAALWLLGHGAPVLRGGAQAPLSVTPLLLGVLAVVRLYREGAALERRRGLRSRWGGPVALWAGYCAVAVGVALHCAGAGVFRSRVLLDVLVVALVAGAALAAGVRSADPEARAHPVLGLLDRLPAPYRPTAGAEAVGRAALAAGAGLVAAGGVLVAVSALLSAVAGGGRGAAWLAGGPAALAGLVLLAVVLLPNAVVWGAAYALGPGFAVGAGTAVAPAGTRLGPLPDFPMLALLPAEGPGGWRWAALLLPALAGVVPALLLGRAAAREPWAPAATVVAGLAVALPAGVGAAVLAWLSGGALAAERMARLGPVPWWTGLAAAGWVALVAVPGALLVRQPALAPSRWTGLARRGALRLRAGAYAAVLRLSSLRTRRPTEDRGPATED
ncbi:DUF6350 family protein [Kitasatospora sp. NPDC051170]|uniref:cell division protein PerM n=1 Tax=Kitasatospora sp. NPDC051170 TaxID=3364056 RepID=UPI0037B4C9C6